MPAPKPLEKRLLLANLDQPEYTPDLACYLRHGGYASLRKAVGMRPADLVAEVKASQLRGRGGAGFPCGVKWGFIREDEKRPVYLICNADESEPGTFKDRQLIHKDPHQLIEGIILSALAVRARLAYIYIRGEFPEGARILEKAIAEARAQQFVGPKILGTDASLEIHVHRGAGAYICGEETGLLESLEGKRAYPRIKPPFFPAAFGLYQCPTIINNVETLCNVVHILRMGGAEYAKIGRPNNTGTRIIGVSGHVREPGYFEIENGALTLGQILNDLCGGVREGRAVKAIIPGGTSSKVLRMGEKFRLKLRQADGALAEKEVGILDLPYDFDSLTAAGTMSGSGGIIVLDDRTDMVKALNNINRFYSHESCGQCTPCREGSLWLQKITDRLVRGGGRPQDVDLLLNIGENIAGRTICAFGEATAWPVQSFVAKFREEFDAVCGTGRR
ncbi:MAG: NADH-quinone oxidoreductase subunit NuoF [Verrucomicrobiae bacterium]|nr:NADH-quinone oxidoreductase subunit NuoF [Verrucomicrobiae bacterium]